MDKKKPSKDERGNVRYLWVLVGAYLLYLAWQQLQLLLQGEAVKTGDVILCVVSGAVFAAVGVWVILREWRAWRYAQTHGDDPETRGDASEEGKTSADALKSLVAGLSVGSAEDSDAPELPKLRTDAGKGDSAEESEGDDEDDEESDEDDDDPDEDDDKSGEDDPSEDDDESGEDDDPDEGDEESDNDDEDPDEDDDKES